MYIEENNIETNIFYKEEKRREEEERKRKRKNETFYK
jgi:hypothetical protein